MAFEWFKPWKWFQSEERDEIQEMKKQIENLQSTVSKLTPREEIKNEKPYINLFFTPPSMITVVLKSGEVIMRADSSEDEFLLIKNVAESEQEIIDLLKRRVEIPKEEKVLQDNVDEMYDEDELAEEEALEIPAPVKKTFNEASLVLLRDEEFSKIDGEYYLLDIPLPIPPVIVGTFIEIAEKLAVNFDEQETLTDRYNALKLFWGWLALNPIEEARRDALRFIIKNNITIDPNGLLIMYRRVVSIKHKTDTEFNEFVTSNYAKVKKAKKGPKNYFVTLHEDEYKLVKNAPEGESLGNLAELYEKIKDSDSNIYTDNHTKTKQIKIGHIYKEDEDKIDLDNRTECSSGLHVGSSEFGFSGFGDTGVIALVNPMKIRSVPLYDSKKMRVSEMFIAAVYDLKDYKDDVMEGKVNSYSSEYCQTSLEELNKAAKAQNLKVLAPKKKPLTVSVKEVKAVSKYLTNRVKQID